MDFWINGMVLRSSGGWIAASILKSGWIWYSMLSSLRFIVPLRDAGIILLSDSRQISDRLIRKRKAPLVP